MRERNELILADLIAARAEARPDLDVLTFEHFSLDGGATADEVRTFADLHSNANRIAAGMIAKGVAPGDRVAAMMRNHPEFVETLIACSITGALFVPVDPRTRGDKLAYMLRHSGCVGIICADYCVAEVAAGRGHTPDLTWIVALETARDTPVPATADGVEPLGEWLDRPTATVDVRVDGPAAPLQIMYTSGTTGDPKGIVGANFRLCASGMLGMLFGYQADERPYTGLSLTHGNAQSMTLVPALSMGLRAVFSQRFTKSKLWDVCRRCGCTTFSLLGGMATAIYSEPPRANDADNPVRMVLSGGMPAAIWEAFERRFNVQILELYGAMDGGGMAYKPVGEGPVGSFGTPMPGVDMRILDAGGNECAPGVVGEICCRPTGGGEGFSVDYFGDPEAAAKKIRAGWNRSGDMGHRDADGWLFFDYRAGGGIRHNGEFINPSFVEKAIAEHPDVADVFVYGVPAASGAPGEKDVVAAIVPAARRLDAAAIFAACRARLEPNFVPTYLQVVDEIPKTASEKPQERLLAEQFAPGAVNVHNEACGRRACGRRSV